MTTWSLLLFYKIELLWFFKLLVSFEILWKCLRKMPHIGSLLRLLRVVFIKLSPCTLRLTEFLEYALVSLLLVECWVLVNLLILVDIGSINFLHQFWITEPSIKHLLIISHECHLSRETLIPVILRFRICVVSLLKRGCVRLISSSVVLDLWILSQVIVKGPFLVRWLIDRL